MISVDDLSHIYRRHGVVGAFKRAMRDPERVRRFLADDSGHFYDLELPVHWEDIVTVVPPIVDAPREDVVAVWEELEKSAFLQSLEDRLAMTEERPDRVHSNWRELLYVIVRLNKPSDIIETGVYDGLSSAYILAALDANAGGRLHSVDVNDPSHVPNDIDATDAGWLVPDWLCDRWLLTYGDARNELPGVIDDASPDIFLHDSLHTPEQMRFEFETALEAMASGTLLMTDNSRFNGVFREVVDSACRDATFWKNTMEARAPSGELIDDRFGAAVVA